MAVVLERSPGNFVPVGKRKRIAIETADEKRIVRALEDWAQTEDFVGLRLRAFVYLLWDGTLRTKAALSLRAQDVVPDPTVLRVSKEIVQPPCEGNRFRELHFHVSHRTRDAIADYLRAARRDGWLPNDSFEGPLFLSSYHRGEGKPAAARTMIHGWTLFLKEHAHVAQDYQLDDVVYTGRLAFLRAAGGDSSLLSEHAAISQTWAAAGYRDKTSAASPKAVLDRLYKK
jgi:integrase